MYTISQVCRLIGVTRRTLQEYDRIGLLKPTDYTEGGYWLYDEEAIEKLKCIQIFIQAGYERKKIKAMMEDPGFSLAAELDRALEFLQEQEKRIRGMAQTIRIMQLPSGMSRSVQNALLRMEETNDSDESFLEKLEKNIRFNGDEVIGKEEEDGARFFLRLAAVAALMDQDVRSRSVQMCTKEFCEDFALMRDRYEDHPQEEMSPAEWRNGIAEMLKDEDIAGALTGRFGPEVIGFIISAVEVFLSGEEADRTSHPTKKEENS